ncbi:hypothetical protein GVAV_003541 [Gurleya vavrai]
MKEGLTLKFATIVMVSSMMGSGIMMMPCAMSSVGYISGTIVLYFISLLCFFTLFAISYAGYVFKKLYVQKEEVSKSEELRIEGNRLDKAKQIKIEIKENESKQQDYEKKDYIKTEDYINENFKLEKQEKTKKSDLPDNREVKKIKNEDKFRSRFEKTENIEKEKEVKEKEIEKSADIKISYYNVTNAYSPFLAILVDICLISQGVGSCLTYTIALKKWIPLLFNKEINGVVIVLIITAPLYILSMKKNLSSLKYASLLSVGSVIYLLILCVYYSFIFRNVSSSELKTEPLVAYDTNFYQAIGIIIFAMGCHQNIVQVFSELENQTVKEITLVSLFCIISGSLIYLIIGLCGYFIAGGGINVAILEILSTHEGIRNYIFENTFDKNGYAIKIGLIAFVCVMLCAFPMQMHPARDSFVNVIIKNNYLKRKVNSNPEYVLKLKRIITTIFCVLIAGTAMIPNIKYGAIMGLIGATATNAITYIFPSIVYCLCVNRLTVKTAISGFVGCFGIFTMIYLLYMQFTFKNK